MPTLGFNLNAPRSLVSQFVIGLFKPSERLMSKLPFKVKYLVAGGLTSLVVVGLLSQITLGYLSEYQRAATEVTGAQLAQTLLNTQAQLADHRGLMGLASDFANKKNLHLHHFQPPKKIFNSNYLRINLLSTIYPHLNKNDSIN